MKIAIERLARKFVNGFVSSVRWKPSQRTAAPAPSIAKKRRGAAKGMPPRLRFAALMQQRKAIDTIGLNPVTPQKPPRTKQSARRLRSSAAFESLLVRATRYARCGQARP